MFNGATTISNTGASGRIRMATVTGDTYNAEATFNSTGQDVQIAYSGDNTFAGNITINSNKVVFNTNTGKVTFTGTNNQTLNGSYNYPFKKLAINKTSGTVTANTTLSVDDSLIFIQGNLITTSTNLLTMKHSSTATGASNSSFVNGPVKKVGNSSFLFPIGSSNIYQPMAISAPGTTNSAFIGQYLVDSMLVNTSSRDTTLGYIYRDRYWNLIRETGSSNVYVTLSWQENHPIIDSNIVVVSWNGTKWIDIGKNQIIGSKLNGNTQSAVVATNYNEFSIGYSIANKPPTSCDCNDVQTAVCLVDCLTFATTPSIVSVTDDIELDQATWGAILPLPILDGVTLQGVSSGVVSKWWESNCPLITTDHTATYDPNNKYTMFLFAIQGNATIEGLRIRGSNLGFKDFNQPTILSGGFYTYGSPIMTMSATFRNIELSGFSYTAIFKSENYDDVQIENCYIHKVKGIHYSGIGYGAWFQADRSGDQIIDINNTIFDDCKAAIDGQGRSPIMTIGDCTLSQFFHSEDINMHNSDDDFSFANCPAGSGTFNMRPIDDTFLPYEITPGANFYSSYWDNTVYCTNLSTPGKIKGPLNSTFSDLLLYPLDSLPAGHIPFYDVDGYQTTIQNCIFHKSWKINGSGNISLRYPNYTLDPTNSFVNVSNCTFATEQFSASAIVDENGNNNAGFCKIADNYILAPVWASDPKIIVGDNSFSYKTGIPLSTTTSAQPFEMALSLIDGTSQLLPFSGTNSGSNHAPKIQFVEVNETFDLTLNMTNNGGSATPRYIVRSNPNTGDPLDNNISGLNFHFDDEFITDATVPIAYDKPGLYGLDVMGFDVNDYGSTSEEYHFNASAWEHIPVIVVDPSEEQMLYFNIRDSYLLNGAASTTVGVRKRAYFNDEIILARRYWKRGRRLGVYCCRF
ncbi:MAG: hypothetical protein IPG39_11065 [Bacteroidetes bacterium]|nr:hypothetical protein [Bacteroidota bacterium]